MSLSYKYLDLCPQIKKSVSYLRLLIAKLDEISYKYTVIVIWKP